MQPGDLVRILIAPPGVPLTQVAWSSKSGHRFILLHVESADMLNLLTPHTFIYGRRKPRTSLSRLVISHTGLPQDNKLSGYVEPTVADGSTLYVRTCKRCEARQVARPVELYATESWKKLRCRACHFPTLDNGSHGWYRDERSGQLLRGGPKQTGENDG